MMSRAINSSITGLHHTVMHKETILACSYIYVYIPHHGSSPSHSLGVSLYAALEYLEPLMQICSATMTDYNTQMRTTKCVNTAVMCLSHRLPAGVKHITQVYIKLYMYIFHHGSSTSHSLGLSLYAALECLSHRLPAGVRSGRTHRHHRSGDSGDKKTSDLVVHSRRPPHKTPY